MNKRRQVIQSLCVAFYATYHVHSFQLKSHPHRLLTRCNVNVGYQYPKNWSDIKPNNNEQTKEQSIVSSKKRPLSPLESLWTKYGMIAYIAHMCAFLPLSLLPTYVQTKMGILNKTESEHQALQVGQKCAQTLHRWIPFMNIDVTPNITDNPSPTIWVSNHVSMLDTFVFLASDEELRGKDRRPIKTIYWKGLDANPIVRILFNMAGFIPIDMQDNGNGNPNVYNRASFKQMLKDTQRAINEGFDILILPEGQLNPTPEQGLQPILPGAYSIAKASKRPIQMVGLYGMHNLWHADESIGMSPVSKDIKIRAFPPMKRELKSGDDFKEVFTAV